MTVSELLTMMKGDVTFQIHGTTDKGMYVKVAYGKVEDIKFPLVPYGKYEIKDVNVIDSKYRLFIMLDSKYNFAKINTEFADITSSGFCGYLED